MSELLSEPGFGLALPLGKKHLRAVGVSEGQAELLEEAPMSEDRRGMLGWVAGHILEAREATNPAQWAIVGMPCPVDDVSQTYGPSQAAGPFNSGSARPFYADLAAAHPDMRALLRTEPDFVSCYNDGALAAVAAAEYVRDRYDDPYRVASLIYGTGNGAGLALRQSNGMYCKDSLACEIGMLVPLLAKVPAPYPSSVPYEQLVSADAISALTGMVPEEITRDHKYAKLFAHLLVAQVVTLDRIFGVDVVVVSGGVGSGIADAYSPHIPERVEAYERAITQRRTDRRLTPYSGAYKVPPIEIVPSSMASSFEALGAWGIRKFVENDHYVFGNPELTRQVRVRQAGKLVEQQLATVALDA